MKKNQRPVLYIHGFRGGDYTTEKMVKSGLKYNGRSDFLKAIINWRGKITYEGTWTDDKQPIIQVVFQNKYVGGNQIAYWLSRLLFDLRSKYRFTDYDAVGHSLGSVALVLVNLNEKRHPFMPKLNHLVLIAGPFNGVLGLNDLPNINQLNTTGKPAFMSPTYFRIFLNRNNVSPNLHVLNVYGNVEDYSNSDKYISVTSAKSINYILKPRVKEFIDMPVTGSEAEHSLMHDDSDILKKVNLFIYANHNAD
ncbi:alpha/beta hydrolase [Companilactobacillus mishanensis]|uniref:Alpha/beta hydrolase n=1 Tax=Companilactobacillus mishanensis TaxID=2486008 RepID=A0A5P0ZHL2_9LACO|nr:alpha/beta hydrolase [Companilactobacillus mishanensis]MQS45490.1 alpha/beta hydrolase [Companilactobacillus mishanensis]MQS52556.1 alpha/beta hydrolase [Companilactobacillus mishanensis]MQS89214.1 alpha/beta hydrolase [Companilactobacillus mishanensis]